MTTLIEDHGYPLLSIGEDVPVERETKRCQTCGKPVRVAILVPVYGHVTNPKDQHHVVRVAKPGQELSAVASDPGRAAVRPRTLDRTREPNARGSARTGDEAPSEPGDRTSVPLRSHRADTDGDIGDPSSGR